jgi:hypothetical protein
MGGLVILWQHHPYCMLAVSRCGLVSLVMSLSAMGLHDSGMHLASKFRASLMVLTEDVWIRACLLVLATVLAFLAFNKVVTHCQPIGAAACATACW